MCIIAYKPLNVAFPEEAILQNCFDNNSDGAGFMYAWNDHVYIQKGYSTFKGFMEALNKVRLKTGDNVPFVMHFRIATQGYEKCMTHPFPLSGNIKNLKRLKVETNIGVAHNGIIDITSDGSKDYSDTMLFITDFLVNIIRSYDWYKDERTKKLIENLIVGSRLAILDKKGHCELMGKGWVEEYGCYFSNSTYSYKRYAYGGGGTSCYGRGLWDDYYGDVDDDGLYYWDYKVRMWKWKGASDDYRWDKDTKKWVKKEEEKKDDSESYLDPWMKYYDEETGTYNFHEEHCPCSEEDDDSYCSFCQNCNNCSYVFACKKASGYNN